MVRCGPLGRGCEAYTLSWDRPHPPSKAPEIPAPNSHLQEKEEEGWAPLATPVASSLRGIIQTLQAVLDNVCVGGGGMEWWSCLILAKIKELPCYKNVDRTERGWKKGNSKKSQHLLGVYLCARHCALYAVFRCSFPNNTVVFMCILQRRRLKHRKDTISMWTSAISLQSLYSSLLCL